MKNFDVAVIGGGPAGYTGAIRAAQLGAKTVLVEKDVLGGTCLNRGCIPTKTLLRTAESVHNIAHAAERGIEIANPSITVRMPKIIEDKNKIVKKLTSGIAALLNSNGVEVYSGEGRLLSPTQIDTGNEKIEAKKIILAGGSRTVQLPIPGINLPGVLTSTEILDLEKIPERLVIIGGGVIGIEIAMIFQSFGSQVSIVEAMPRILPFMDTEISALIHKVLRARGIEITTGEKVSHIEQNQGKLKLCLSTRRTVDADIILVSTGRTADVSCLGEVPLKTEAGKVAVDAFMETSVPGIYAPGDINGRKMLAHAAFKMAEIAAANAVGAIKSQSGAKIKTDFQNIPSVVYSFPEAASVGFSEEEIPDPVVIGRFPLSFNGKALASGDSEGFVKIIADKKYGKIMGVHIVGPGASEIINEAAALMAMEITVNELADIIHAHPTVSEALKEAAADCLGHCIHLPSKKQKIPAGGTKI